MLPRRVAGRQNIITDKSATARFKMKMFVIVLIFGNMDTTKITKMFPSKPSIKTARYAMTKRVVK